MLISQGLESLINPVLESLNLFDLLLLSVDIEAVLVRPDLELVLEVGLHLPLILLELLDVILDGVDLSSDLTFTSSISSVSFISFDKINEVTLNLVELTGEGLKFLSSFVDVGRDHAIVHLLLNFINLISVNLKLLLESGKSLSTSLELVNLDSHFVEVSSGLLDVVGDNFGLSLLGIEVLIDLDKIVLNLLEVVHIFSDLLLFIVVVSLSSWTSSLVHLLKGSLENLDLFR